MKAKVVLLVVGLFSISLIAGAISYFGEIVDGGGAVDFGNDGGPILLGNLEFQPGSVQWGELTTFTMQVDIGLVNGPELGAGLVPYSQFISISTDPEITFNEAQLSMLVLPEIAALISDGSSATLYTNDGSGWVPYGEATVTAILSGEAYLLQATIDHFSDWGGIGGDPLIPDPSVASIIGCGLLLLGRKLRS